MSATIIPFPTTPRPAPVPLCPLVGTWVHDLVRGRPMRVVAAEIQQGKVVNYTLFDAAYGIDVNRMPSQIETGCAGGAA